MMMGRVLVLAVVAFVGCAAPPPPPPPPTGLTTVVVAPVTNKTGSALAIAGDTYVEKWMGVTRRAVPDALAKELETTLRDEGFAVGGSGPRLTVVLRRFEPDLPQLSYVTVSLTATLTDPDGTVRWTVDRSSWLVSTTGSPSLKVTYETAVRTVARGLVDDWQPAH